ncbi:MAG TPA: lysylphosphatidylglycerol synthase transmembrane domain-containing protein [Gemmatimonadales bacterium]|nr:lysylphosphatidylglycerol synthase transmembrane domain-containing protein [Gemmatimonadales bacterium]
MPLALTPRLLRRGLELFAVISLGAVALLFAYYLIRFGDRVDVFLSPFLRLHWGWIAVGLVLASMDWVGGGLRLWVCTRHVHPGVRLRDMILAGGFGAWAAYLTPFQSGSAPMSTWVMKRAGVPVPEAVASIFVTFIATVGFFAIAGPLAVWLGAGKSLAQHGLVLGITLYDLFKTSLTIFGVIGLLMLAAVIFPGVVKRLLQQLAARIARRSPRAAERMERLSGGVDRAHDCMVAFGSPKGLLTLLLAIIISAPSHANKLLAGYVTLRVLGIPADFTDILLLQTLISFLLYFAPTPGGSGLAELTSAAVMSIYVPRELTPSYTLIWRFINSYATVIVGSSIFWYWLRRGLIGREESVGIT